MTRAFLPRKWWTPEVKDELKHIWSVLWPIAMTNALLMSLQIEDQIILGRIGVDELAASALGTTLFNLAWFFLAGAASAVDTLVAQAFGARDYAACEYWTRIGYLLMTLLSLPAMIIFQYGEWVVHTVLRQDQHLAHLAGQYTKLLLPGLWPLCMFVTMQKSMQARNVLMPSLWIMLLANFLNVGGNYLFIYALDMGFRGSPLATSTSRILTCLLTAIYYYGFMPKAHPHAVQGQICPEVDLKGEEPEDVLVGKQQQQHGGGMNGNGNGSSSSSSNSSSSSSNSSKKKAAAEGDSLRQPLLSSSDGPSSSAAFSPVPDSLPPSVLTADTAAAAAGKVPFREALWRFLCLAIPGGFMVGLEAWSFDFTTSFAAQFGTEALDAHQSMMSISAFTYLTVPLAISIAASIRVGNLLGAQRPKQAQVAAKICLVIGVATMLLCGMVLVLLRGSLGKIFTPDAKVVKIVSQLCPIMALYQVFDGFQGVSAGVLRGMGRQTRVALLNLGGFWVLGLPGGALLAFTFDLGVYGIWWGFVMGLALISLLYLWALSKLDFEAEARRALINACTDQKLEQAWEETVEQEKIGREGGVEAAALVGVVGEGDDDFDRV